MDPQLRIETALHNTLALAQAYSPAAPLLRELFGAPGSACFSRQVTSAAEMFVHETYGGLLFGPVPLTDDLGLGLACWRNDECIITFLVVCEVGPSVGSLGIIACVRQSLHEQRIPGDGEFVCSIAALKRTEAGGRTEDEVAQSLAEMCGVTLGKKTVFH